MDLTNDLNKICFELQTQLTNVYTNIDIETGLPFFVFVAFNDAVLFVL